MASIPRRLLFYSGRSPSRISPVQIAPRRPTQWRRPLSSTVPRGKDAASDPPKPEIISRDPLLTTAEPAAHNSDVSASMSTNPSSANPKASTTPPANPQSSSKPAFPSRMTSEEERAAQLKKLMADLEALNPEAILEATNRGERGLPWSDDLELSADEDFKIEQEKGKLGFWAEGEEELGPDEDYYADDLTSHGHGELEQHRELREYARLIAWELPLLNQLARPFELPTASTPFRFRYTSYLGESHPATNKVVVEFSVSDMPNLQQRQKDKLIKLAGPRYNPDTDIIKMNCEMFDTQAQNKRFLGDTISKLLAEARNMEDDFADVPFDFRHHKPKVKHEFPKEWILTPERKKYLEEKRQRMLKLDDERVNNGKMIDGQKIVETALPFTMPTLEPVMVGGPRGKQLR